MSSVLFSLIIKRSMRAAYLCALTLFFGTLLASDWSGAANSAEILSVSSLGKDNMTEVRIKTSAQVISTIYEIPKPDRIIIDIAEAKFSKQFSANIHSDAIKVTTKEIIDTTPNISRIELLLAQKASFESKKDGLEIVLSLKADEKVVTAATDKASIDAEKAISTESGAMENNNADARIPRNASAMQGKDKISGVINTSKAIDTQLPEVRPLDNKLSSKAKDRQMQDAFNFSGYNKERITVEFQKMDLHNVFNFLRQVSGVNIVVDESVQGSLTLVLDDVPWDFALDIILNLKGLEKEERFNTLVIYPKGKAYKWPEQGQNNLSFQPDTKVVERESIVIRQQEKQPIEAAEARQDIALGKEAERQENYDAAVAYYEKALEKWPSNSKLANKISSIYLVQLRQNAKALYFAKIAMEKDASNHAAALNAAIASANMNDRQKAATYFNQCTQGKKPSREALLSYAAFSEDQKDYAGALKILEKHNTIYGEDLDAMVTSGRIYDKMGQKQQATEKYRKIKLSGYNIPPDLDRYIQERVAQ